MHSLIALLSLVVLVWLVVRRAQQARGAPGDLQGAGNDVKSAARRLNTHPADAVDDARLAASGIVVAVATMDQPISQAEIRSLTAEAQRVFNISDREALDIVSFGRWIVGQCGTNEEAVRRLSKRVATLAGAEALPDLLAMVETVATADDRALDEAEQDALLTIRQAIGH